MHPPDGELHDVLGVEIAWFLAKEAPAECSIALVDGRIDVAGAGQPAMAQELLESRSTATGRSDAPVTRSTNRGRAAANVSLGMPWQR